VHRDVIVRRKTSSHLFRCSRSFDGYRPSRARTNRYNRTRGYMIRGSYRVKNREKRLAANLVANILLRMKRRQALCKFICITNRQFDSERRRMISSSLFSSISNFYIYYFIMLLFFLYFIFIILSFIILLYLNHLNNIYLMIKETKFLH